MLTGEVAEWPIVQHWKCCVWVTGPGVRIPLSPLLTVKDHPLTTCDIPCHKLFFIEGLRIRGCAVRHQLVSRCGGFRHPFDDERVVSVNDLSRSESRPAFFNERENTFLSVRVRERETECTLFQRCNCRRRATSSGFE